MEKRQRDNNDEQKLKTWTAVLNPVRFREVFLAEDTGVIDRTEEGLGVNPEDFESIDKYLRDLDKMKTMTGE